MDVMINEPLNYEELGKTIKEVFASQNLYQFDKHVPVFTRNDSYSGDFFNITSFEPCGENPPIFYHTFSPYDIISKKSPAYASVLQGGELLLSGEVSSYIKQRTAVMTPLVLHALSEVSLAQKKVLFIGTGNIARCALEAFKVWYPDIRCVDYVNSGGPVNEFTVAAKSLDIEVAQGSLEKIGQYDIIVCHSAASQPILTREMLAHIKPGAFISTFVSEDHAEVVEEYYDTLHANVLIDREQTANEAVELRAAIDHGIADKEKLILLRDVFANKLILDQSKKLTIYRSHGTPMQDVAFLKLLLDRPK